jgi:hypothetical protein
MYLRAAFGEQFDSRDLDAAQPALAQFAATFRRNVRLPLRLLGMLNPLGAIVRRL